MYALVVVTGLLGVVVNLSPVRASARAALAPVGAGGGRHDGAGVAARWCSRSALPVVLRRRLVDRLVRQHELLLAAAARHPRHVRRRPGSPDRLREDVLPEPAPARRRLPARRSSSASPSASRSGSPAAARVRSSRCWSSSGRSRRRCSCRSSCCSPDIGNTMKMLVIVSGCIWPVLLNTVEGVRGRRRGARDTAAVLPARAGSPGCGTSCCAGPARRSSTGARQALSIGIILMVISEMFAASNGHRLHHRPVPAQLRHPGDVERHHPARPHRRRCSSVIFRLVERRALRLVPRACAAPTRRLTWRTVDHERPATDESARRRRARRPRSGARSTTATTAPVEAVRDLTFSVDARRAGLHRRPVRARQDDAAAAASPACSTPTGGEVVLDG